MRTLVGSMGDWRTTSDPMARAAIDEIDGDAPLVDAMVIESLAAGAFDGARCADARAMADASGCRVVHEPSLPENVPAALSPDGTILVRIGRDLRRIALAILHELAHWLLRRLAHTHGDVWLLTLALAMPLPAFRAARACGARSITDLMQRFNVPAWSIVARLEMLAVRRAA